MEWMSSQCCCQSSGGDYRVWQLRTASLRETTLSANLSEPIFRHALLTAPKPLSQKYPVSPPRPTDSVAICGSSFEDDGAFTNSRLSGSGRLWFRRVSRLRVNIERMRNRNTSLCQTHCIQILYERYDTGGRPRLMFCWRAAAHL